MLAAGRPRGAPVELNFYQKAQFANSFKWRLIENGIERSCRRSDSISDSASLQSGGRSDDRARPAALATAQRPARAALCWRAQKGFEGANMPRPWNFLMSSSLVPGHADALNDLGVAL